MLFVCVFPTPDSISYYALRSKSRGERAFGRAWSYSARHSISYSNEVNYLYRGINIHELK